MYLFRYTVIMTTIESLGDSLARIRDVPDDARAEAGFQLREVQKSNDPADLKPFPTVGPDVREMRIRDEAGAFRVIQLATAGDTVAVLHAF